MADRREKQESKGYKIVVSSVRGVVQILAFVFVVVLIIFLAKKAYNVGYDVFNQRPVETGEGTAVGVKVTPDMTVKDIGNMLREKGLIKESTLVFCLQERLSDHHNQLKPGIYLLNTNMTPDEMMAIMAQKVTEGQPDNSTGNETDAGGKTGTENAAGNGAAGDTQAAGQDPAAQQQAVQEAASAYTETAPAEYYEGQAQ